MQEAIRKLVGLAQEYKQFVVDNYDKSMDFIACDDMRVCVYVAEAKNYHTVTFDSGQLKNSVGVCFHKNTTPISFNYTFNEYDLGDIFNKYKLVLSEARSKLEPLKMTVAEIEEKLGVKNLHVVK